MSVPRAELLPSPRSAGAREVRTRRRQWRTIRVSHESGRAVDGYNWLAQIARRALRRHGVTSADINVALVSDSTIARLNERFLNHPGPTDVLTFDSNNGDGRRNGQGAGIAGEIVISVDTASRQARQRGHTVKAELALYLVHGTLHLLGYNDVRTRDAMKMHRMEDEILSDAGFGRVYGTAESDRESSEPQKAVSVTRRKTRARARRK